MPVDLYVGGAEHTVLHLLYSRFITKVLYDAKLIDFDEPFMKLRHVGMILGLDGQKMSKSRGNVINPDEVVKAFGADTLRLYEMFMGPLSDKKPWDMHGVEGSHRFLRRIWQLISSSDKQSLARCDAKLWSLTQELVGDVERDINDMKFNTAIAKQMSWLNNAVEIVNSCVLSHNKGLDSRGLQADKHGYEKNITEESVLNPPEIRVNPIAHTIGESLKVFLLILAPFAPHLTEELWFKLSAVALKDYKSIHLESWPAYDKYQPRQGQKLTFLVEVSGKVVEKILFEKNDPIYQKQSTAQEEALKLNKVISKLQSQSSKIKKVVFLPGKLINFVV